MVHYWAEFRMLGTILDLKNIYIQKEELKQSMWDMTDTVNCIAFVLQSCAKQIMLCMSLFLLIIIFYNI